MTRHFATRYLSVIANHRIGVVLLLGFSSGLPLALTSGTLQAWLTVAGIDITTIGIFALAGLPYTLKFLWAPLLDHFVPPWLGRRRGWMFLTQAGLMVGIATMAGVRPEQTIQLLGVLALLVAFLSASQDIAFDAYRTDILHPQERGLGAALSVFGYRLAMLLSGAVALILSDHIGWQNTYYLMAVLMSIGMVTTLCAPEPVRPDHTPQTLQDAVVEPFTEFMSRKGALLFLLLIVLYKLGDAFAGTLTTTFLIRGLGFTATDVGIVNKGMGLIAVLVGAIAGGTLMIRLGLYRALMLFGIFQALTNLGFMLLAWLGKNYLGMVAVIAMENLAGGMGTAAFVALLMALCDHRYTATQFALLSALAAIGRVFVGPASGYMVNAIGWIDFFFVTFLMALPGLGLLRAARQQLYLLETAKGQGTSV